MTSGRNILLLGGTIEARQLAADVQSRGWPVTVSLAGVTRKPADYGVPTRRGGFGGVDGLIDYIQSNNVSHLINATHPFAAGMTANVAAAALCGVACLHLRRPKWRETEGDSWTLVPSMEVAAKAIPAGAVAFLATGRGSVEAFSTRKDIATILRVIELPELPEAGPRHTRVIARPPFSVEHEMETLGKNGITHLVCKNSGGQEMQAKLIAARHLRLPVIMVERPTMPEGARVVHSAHEVIDWIALGP